MSSTKFKEMKIVFVISLPLNLTENKGGVHTACLNLLSGFSAIDSISIIVISFTAGVKEKREQYLYDNLLIKYFPKVIFLFKRLILKKKKKG